MKNEWNSNLYSGSPDLFISFILFTLPRFERQGGCHMMDMSYLFIYISVTTAS